MPHEPSYERYQRQMILSGFGVAAQQKLSEAKVLVLGAGGLGCPALQYLTAAGVGTIGVVDDDVVSRSNLHRQTLYGAEDVGEKKVTVAADKLRALNDEIAIHTYPIRLTSSNVLELITGYDFVLDGADNFATRYLINDACVLLGKPLIYGAIAKFEGQVAVFNVTGPGGGRAVNYRDLFPNPPAEMEVPNCAEAGVLGVLPGIIGTMQAAEVIKLITGIGEPLIGRLLIFDLLRNGFYEMQLTANDAAQRLIPASKAAFQEMDYEWLCGVQKNPELEIDAATFRQLIHDEGSLVIDVREEGELPVVTEFPHRKIPLNQLSQQRQTLRQDTLVLFCQSGKRSLKAAAMLQKMFPEKRVFSLKDGVNSVVSKNFGTGCEALPVLSEVSGSHSDKNVVVREDTNHGGA